jgi:seryl-tRNA synthetase
MLDPQDFIERNGGNPEKIRASQRARNAPVEIVDEVIAQFESHRTAKYDAMQLNTRINEIQKDIGKRMKAKEDATELLAQKAKLTTEKQALEDRAAAENVALLAKIKTIGNYVHESVPVGNDEANNAVVREWKPEEALPRGAGKPEKMLSHHQVLTRLGGYDPERAIKLVGHRGYCLTGYGLFLNQALINYALEFLHTKGYTPNQPPFFMKGSMMAKTAQLSQFDEELYKIAGAKDDDADEDKYLIATSEQPISCLHSDEWLQKGELPIKYAGYSTCFRKEAGAHGRDAWGIFVSVLLLSPLRSIFH